MILNHLLIGTLIFLVFYFLRLRDKRISAPWDGEQEMAEKKFSNLWTMLKAEWEHRYFTNLFLFSLNIFVIYHGFLVIPYTDDPDFRLRFENCPNAQKGEPFFIVKQTLGQTIRRAKAIANEPDHKLGTLCAKGNPFFAVTVEVRINDRWYFHSTYPYQHQDKD